jgi:RNA polymerase sigma-70 factor (ECF subfamily)
MSIAAVTRGSGQLSESDRERDLERELDRFLRDIEARAYRIAAMSVGDADGALDIVQDAMIRLVRGYAQRPTEEWRPLFYRILRNRINDWYRRRAVRDSVLRFFGGQQASEPDPVASAADPTNNDPQDVLAGEQALAALEAGIALLPARQREAFLLRNFEGLSVRDTASAMGCSDGSVKTHYSRALHRLREALGEHY